MIISCQACSTRYLIEPAALGPRGRLVRCAKCGHSWQQKPPADMPHQIDADAPPPGMVNLPHIAPAPRRWSRGLAMPLLVIVLLLAALGGGYFFRNRIVAHWPQSAQIYEAIGLPIVRPEERLELANISSMMEPGGPDHVLQIQGEIFNPTNAEVKLPRLQASLRDDSGKRLFDWVFDAGPATIRPGEIIPFKTETRNPPDAGDEDRRRFRGGSVGGLRADRCVGCASCSIVMWPLGCRTGSPILYGVMVGEGRPSTSLPAEGGVYPNGCKRRKD